MNKEKYIYLSASPLLLESCSLREHSNTSIVVIDILRATTTICTAFKYGVKALIPVGAIEKAKALKEQGFMVAGERLEGSLPFADMGNSAFEFMNPKIKGQVIAHTTTNGTQAIEQAKGLNGKEILIGSFLNLSALALYLQEQNTDVLLLCSGWKGSACIEDTAMAGALIEKLHTNIARVDDASSMALTLWQTYKKDLLGYMDSCAHIHRLRNKGLGDVFEYSFTPDTAPVVPKLLDGRLINILN